MTTEEIRKIAEEAERRGEKALAVVLFTYLGAKQLGRERLLSNYVSEFAQNEIYNINYFQWMWDGGK